VKQQQQNLILQKQRKIDRHEAQADRNVLQQGQASCCKPAPKEKLATVQEEPATPSPEAAVVLTETPPPSQNRPKPARRPPIMIDVGIQECLVPVSEPPAGSTVSVSEGPMLGLATGLPLPTSHGPLVIPRGPVVAATPQPLVNPDVGQAVYSAGAHPVGSLIGSKPLVDPVSHLPTGLAAYPAYLNNVWRHRPYQVACCQHPPRLCLLNQCRLVLRLHYRLPVPHRCLRLLLVQILGRLMLA